MRRRDGSNSSDSSNGPAILPAFSVASTKRNSAPTGALDFTSALYLGFRHPSWSLRRWPQFTTGKPAALASPSDAERVACHLASLQGCEAGVAGTSTFHLFWDLFGMLAQGSAAIFFDAGLYAIARWGIERAEARGATVQQFAHHDAAALQRAFAGGLKAHQQPVVVTDGFCPGCGEPAPLAAYLASVRAAGGLLVVDDTQALGIFGHSHGSDAPYGLEGGGMLRWAGINGPDMVMVSSLAKGFGAPLAVLSGSQTTVAEFQRKSETRVHCSPPSIATLRAAERALHLNRERGNRLRLRLAHLVRRFRSGAAQTGFSFIGGSFPMQTLIPGSREEAGRIHEGLLRKGIQTVLRQLPDGRNLRVSFLITARHAPEAIDRVIRVLTDL